jgi:hypothetical protein
MKALHNSFVLIGGVFFALFIFVQCESDNEEDLTPRNPDETEVVSVDRFSDEAGTLMKRSENAELPSANEPINFDEEPFITQSLGPEGHVVKYYNFDVQPLAPVPIYVLFKEGADSPVEGQLNIINTIPGDAAYSDFWLINKVTVPDDYVANTISSYQEIVDKGYTIEPTNSLVNCPVVPEGSSADLRYNGVQGTLDRGWYQNKVVYYFTFEEKALEVDPNGLVPTSPIYVTFNINPDPDNPSSGPASGFMTEAGSSQTHNVIATIPSESDYSPLWKVHVYDNADFDSVSNLSTVLNATILNESAGYVNCPLVYREE